MCVYSTRSVTMEKKLKIGDTIQCADADDLIDTMTELAQNGVITDWTFEKDGQKGLWLVVEEIEE